MTEQEWLDSADPCVMLDFLQARGDIPERKIRLFTAACCRRIWPLLTDERSRRTVEVLEKYADGMAGADELSEAAQGAEQATYGHISADATQPSQAILTAVVSALPPEYPGEHDEFRVDYFQDATESLCDVAFAAADALGLKQWTDERYLAEQAEWAAHCELLRCIAGNPFRPALPLPAAVLAWNDETIRRLAQSIYDTRAFEQMPVLADALEEAGCTDGAILEHCRGPGPHARGCWVMDLLTQ
jgi:hypothetical protein